jgi:Holliday junction resolvase RusA-like endonuclease
MVGGRIRPTKRPDVSNVIKIIEDALNGLAYRDDSQIVRVVGEKYYSDSPRVEVEICSLSEPSDGANSP